MMGEGERNKACTGGLLIFCLGRVLCRQSPATVLRRQSPATIRIKMPLEECDQREASVADGLC